MRLVSFEVGGEAKCGLVNEDGVVDLSRRFAGVASLKDLLEKDLVGEAGAFASNAPDYLLADVQLLPTIPDPAHVWCLAINYQDHIDEVRSIGINRDTPEKPALFMRYSDTLIAEGEAIIRPSVSDHLDYEAELAVVIGVGGANIDEADAMKHVAGYTCFNDASVRDWQFHTRQIAPGKNFVATGALGPWMVTADEVEDPHELNVSLTLNGNVLQKGNTRDMIFSIPQFISYVSKILPLKVGDILATGTPSGVGFSRKPPIFMTPGDICEVEVEKVGKLTSRVVAA